MRFVEPLEGRRLFASYTAANVSELISAMSSAIRSGQADTITLAAGVTFSLSSANDITNGAVGLPRVTGGGGLTIVGNGSTIERSTASGTGAFRLLDIASNGSVTIQNLTLQGGSATAQGGAIYTAGTLNLDSVVVRNNTVQGAASVRFWSENQPAGAGAGGGVFCAGGALTLSACRFENNSALGGRGGDSIAIPPADPGSFGYTYSSPSAGGAGSGGALCLAAGTASISNCTFAGIAQSAAPEARGTSPARPAETVTAARSMQAAEILRCAAARSPPIPRSAAPAAAAQLKSGAAVPRDEESVAGSTSTPPPPRVWIVVTYSRPTWHQRATKTSSARTASSFEKAVFK